MPPIATMGVFVIFFIFFNNPILALNLVFFVFETLNAPKANYFSYYLAF